MKKDTEKHAKNQPSLMTINEIVDYLQVKIRTIYNLIRKGELPAVKIGKEWRFYREDVEKYLKEKRIRYGIDSIGKEFFWLEALDKYKNDQYPFKYYIYDEAFAGEVGERLDWVDVKSSQSLQFEPPPGYKPFILPYRKVTLRDGRQVLALNPADYINLPTEEHSYWTKFLIPRGSDVLK